MAACLCLTAWLFGRPPAAGVMLPRLLLFVRHFPFSFLVHVVSQVLLWFFFFLTFTDALENVVLFTFCVFAWLYIQRLVGFRQIGRAIILCCPERRQAYLRGRTMRWEIHLLSRALVGNTAGIAQSSFLLVKLRSFSVENTVLMAIRCFKFS